MAKESNPDRARRISADTRRRARETPTTGDGFRHTQKPKPSETNGVPRFGGWVAKLITRATDGGKHS